MSDKKIIPFPAPSKRAWKAASQSLLFSGWESWTRPIDIDIRNGLKILRAKSREQAQNNDLVRGYLLDLKTNVIGNKGIKLRGRNHMRNGKLDKPRNDATENAWRKWCKRGTCDVTGQLSFRACEALAIETAAKDGEFIVRIVENYPHEFGIALQFIDPEMLDSNHNEELPNGNTIRMGVELNEWRRPVAYWITDETKSAYTVGYQDTNRKRVRVPADQIIHGYLPEWVWQTRGIPWLATSINTMKSEDGYTEAAITAARAAASKMAFYTQNDENPPGTDIGGEKTDQGDFVKDAVPGGMEVLPMGYDVQTVDWNWPNADHGTFLKPILRRIATGLGVNYNTWANDYEGVNFSSLRKGALKERDVWKMLQTWLIETLHEPVFERWLEVALINGAIRRPNGMPYDFTELPRLGNVAWQARGWQWVDPQKEEAANEIAVRNRTRSLSDIIRDRGEDPDDVWEEIAADMEKLKALGITPAAAPTSTEKEQADDNESQDKDD